MRRHGRLDARRFVRSRVGFSLERFSGLVFLYLAFVSIAFANDLPNRSPADWSTGPVCIEDSVNGLSGGEEKAVEKLTENLSDDELYSRLVFSESLASRCFTEKSADDALMSATARGIAWVVLNRVRANKMAFGLARGVVTAPKQFRSSFGTCDVAKRREFLCPVSQDANEAFRKKVWDAAVTAVQGAKDPRNNPVPGVYHYFFPRHYDGSKNCGKWAGKSPAWAVPANRANLPVDFPAALGACLEFYRLPI